MLAIIITVYQPDLGAYVPVCLSGVNRAAAATVCRRLGFVDAKPFTTGDYVTPPSMYYKYDLHMFDSTIAFTRNILRIKSSLPKSMQPSKHPPAWRDYDPL